MRYLRVVGAADAPARPVRAPCALMLAVCARPTPPPPPPHQAVCAELVGTLMFVFISVSTVTFTFDASFVGVEVGLNRTNATSGGSSGSFGARSLDAAPLVPPPLSSAGGASSVGASVGNRAPPPWLVSMLATERRSVTTSTAEERAAAWRSQGGIPGAPASAPTRDPARFLAPLTGPPAVSGPNVTVVTVRIEKFGTSRSLMFALAAGLTVGVLVFALGSISGANLNPAITLALAVTQRMSSFRAACYVVCQCAGAVVGALLVRSLAPVLFQESGGGANGRVFEDAERVGPWTIIGGEMLGTSVVVLAVCAAADVGREKGNKYQGALTPLAIGLATVATHLFLIPIDGCSTNPARSFGTAVASGNWEDQWFYWLGPLLGSAVAALFYTTVFSNATERVYTRDVPEVEPVAEEPAAGEPAVGEPVAGAGGGAVLRPTAAVAEWGSRKGAPGALDLEAVAAALSAAPPPGTDGTSSTVSSSRNLLHGGGSRSVSASPARRAWFAPGAPSTRADDSPAEASERSSAVLPPALSLS